MQYKGLPVVAITIQDLYTVRCFYTANGSTQCDDVSLAPLGKAGAMQVLDFALATCTDEIAAAMITDAMKIVGVV